MYDPEDIKSERRQSNPPWELTPRSRLREWFSSRTVEGEQEQLHRRAEQKKREERARHQQERANQELLWEQERARRQARLDRKPEDQTQAQAQTPPTPPRDPRGDRYTYPNLNGGGKMYRAGGAVGVAVVICFALVISLLLQYGMISFGTQVEYDTWYGDDAILPDGDEDSSDDVPWSTEIPEQSSSESDTATNELERAELDQELQLNVVSSEGLTALSYGEIYAKCLPSTVSISVVTADGVATGTGIVMTEDGYILTCNHVIADGVTCTVTTSDDQVYDASLVGGDAQTDLAILKIDAQGLTPAEFGDSDELTVGDEALAIGDPLGTELRGTLTNGIISAINRNVTVNSYSMTLLQTTAALNSGNSGGPLINIYGQVVGVNNMKMNSTSVTVEGLGFAVPTSVVRQIVPLLSTEGKVSRPVLGITCYSIDDETAALNDAPVTGLLVASVNELSDAYAQGLQVGDYITAVNGISVVSVDEVKEIIDGLTIGDTIDVEVYRIDEETGNAETFSLTIALVDQSEIS